MIGCPSDVCYECRELTAYDLGMKARKMKGVTVTLRFSHSFDVSCFKQDTSKMCRDFICVKNILLELNLFAIFAIVRISPFAPKQKHCESFPVK